MVYNRAADTCSDPDMSYRSYSPLTLEYYGLSHSLYLAAKDGNYEGLKLRHRADSWSPIIRGAVVGRRPDVLILILSERTDLKPMACEACVLANALDLLSNVMVVMSVGDLNLGLAAACYSSNYGALNMLVEHGAKGSPELGRSLARLGRLGSLKILIEAQSYSKLLLKTFVGQARNFRQNHVVSYLNSLL